MKLISPVDRVSAKEIVLSPARLIKTPSEADVAV